MNSLSNGKPRKNCECIYDFSKNLFTCCTSIKTRKNKLLKTPQNARAFKHAARTTLFSLKLTFFS